MLNRRTAKQSVAVCMAYLMCMTGKGFPHEPDKMTPRDVALEQAIQAAASARDEITSSNTAGQEAKDTAQSIVANMFVWPPDEEIIRVCFFPSPLPGGESIDDQEERDIIPLASKWVSNTSIKFDFLDGTTPRRCVDHASSDIRVTLHPLAKSNYSSLDPIGFDWSRYGRQSDDNAANVSMSLVEATVAYLNDSNSSYFHFNVTHEFGHALGLMHEHQRLDCVKWLADDATVMKVYDFKTKEQLDVFKQNLQQIPASSPYYEPRALSKFDINSIMMYNFPNGIWKQGQNNPCLRATQVEYPDATDIAGVTAIYPPRLATVAAAPPAGSTTGAPSPPAASVTPVPAPTIGSPVKPLGRQKLDQISASLILEGLDMQKRGTELAAQGRASVQGFTKSRCLDVSELGLHNCIPFNTHDQGSGERVLRSQVAQKLKQLQNDVTQLDKLKAAVDRILVLGTQ